MHVLRLRNDSPNKEESDDDDRNIDEEDRAPFVVRQPIRPGGVLQQQTAKDRPKGDGGSDATSPDANCLATLVRWEDHRDDGQSCRQNCRTADAHDRAPTDEHASAGGEGAHR